MGTSVNVGSFPLWVRLWGKDSSGGAGAPVQEPWEVLGLLAPCQLPQETPSPLQGSPARAAAACRTGRGRRGHVQASVLWLGDHRHLVHGPRLHPGEHHVSGPRSPPPRRTPVGPQRCLWERWGKWQAEAPSGQDSGSRSSTPMLHL